MFLEKSKMIHVAEISPIIPLYFALHPSNSHALLLVFLESVVNRAHPLQKPALYFFCATHDKIKHCAKDFSIQTLTSTNLLPHLCKWYSPDPRPKSTGHTVSIPQISLRTPPLQCLVPRKCSQTVDNVPGLLLLCLPLFFPRYLSHYILPFKCLFCFILICFFLLHASVFEH